MGCASSRPSCPLSLAWVWRASWRVVLRRIAEASLGFGCASLIDGQRLSFVESPVLGGASCLFRIALMAPLPSLGIPATCSIPGDAKEPREPAYLPWVTDYPGYILSGPRSGSP